MLLEVTLIICNFICITGTFSDTYGAIITKRKVMRILGELLLLTGRQVGVLQWKILRTPSDSIGNRLPPASLPDLWSLPLACGTHRCPTSQHRHSLPVFKRRLQTLPFKRTAYIGRWSLLPAWNCRPFLLVNCSRSFFLTPWYSNHVRFQYQ